MSFILLTLPLLWAQVNPAPPGAAAKAPEAAQVKDAGSATKVAAPVAANPAAAPNAAAPNAAVQMPALPAISQEWGNILAWLYLSGDSSVTLFAEPGLTRRTYSATCSSGRRPLACSAWLAG